MHAVPPSAEQKTCSWHQLQAHLALFLMLDWTSGANLLGLDLYLWSATTSTSKGECIEEYSVYYTYLLKRLLECFQLPIVKMATA